MRPRASRDPGRAQVPGPNATFHLAQVHDPRRSDQAIEGDPVDADGTGDEMPGGVDMRTGV